MSGGQEIMCMIIKTKMNRPTKITHTQMQFLEKIQDEKTAGIKKQHMIL